MSDAGFGDSKLGGLPSLMYGPVDAQQVQVPNTGPTVDAWNNLAGQAEAIGNRYLEQQATQQGSAAVTRDAQGNIQTATPRIPLTPADEAYNNAESIALLSQKQIDAYGTISALKQQYPNDPDGFRTAWDKASGDLLDGVPGSFSGAVREQLDREGAAAYQDVLTQSRADTVAQAQNSTEALFKINESKLQPFISNGTWQSDPNAQSLINQNLAMLDAKMNNPAFPTYTKAQHDLDANNFLNGITAQAAVAKVPEMYQQYGRAEGERQFAGMINSLPVDFQTKSEYLSKGLNEFRMQDYLARQDQEQAVQGVRYAADDAKNYALSGQPGGWRSRLPESQIWGVYVKQPAQARALIDSLDLADGIGQIGNEIPLASPSDMAALQQKYAAPSGAPATPATPRMPIGQAIFGQESNFGANTKPNGVSAGPMQITPDTWSTAQKEGLVQPGESINNRQDNYDVGQRLVSHYQQQFGNDPARVAVAYFSGPGNVSAAGSPNPYVRNVIDPTSGKSTDSYVSDVLGRMGLTGSTIDQSIQLRLSNAFEAAQKQRDSQIAADPADYVLNNAPDVQQQISSQDPDTRSAGVRALLGWESHIGVAPGDQAVFTKDQASQLSNTLQFSPPDQAVAALDTAMAGMTPQQAQIAARQVAPNNRAFAMAASAVPSDPTTAANIIMGEQYLLQNPDVKPDPKKSGAAFDTATGGSDSGMFTSGTGGLFQFAPDARANAQAATDALYAKSMIGQSAMKPTGSNFDANRYTQAMTLAFGGAPITVRGQIIPPPRAGYDANKTEDMLTNLSAPQIAQYGNGTPVLANGKPVAASDIAQHGVLTWTGSPGVYRVRFPGQGHLGVSGSTDGSRTFMINLGALASGAMPPLPDASSHSSWVQ
jgi:hypothetical protein